MAARNQHRTAVAGTNVRECHQGVDLATHEAAAMVAKLVPMNRRKAARVQPDGLARSPEAGETLVDEQRSMMVIESALAADEELDPLDP